MDNVYLLKWFQAVIPSLSFLLILWILLKPKCSRPAALAAGLGFLAAELVVQGTVLALGQSPELVFTLFPLTLHLPAILCFHLLSGNRFLPSALTWLLALLCEHLLLALQKLLTFLHGILGGPVWAWGFCGMLALAALLLLLLIFCFLRAPFLACMETLEGSWPLLLFLPVMLLALYSYFLSSTTNPTVLFLLFLTALAAFLVLSRLIASLAAEQQAGAFRRQMETLRQDYEVLQKKLELGRSYRHDMRHHMTALSALLQQGGCDEAQAYVAKWQGQLTQIETETWCRNAAVNGVLSAYLSQAKNIGCTIEADVSLPQEFPFEEIDLCVVLANALENAIHACEAMPAGASRHIKLYLTSTDRRRFTICVENSCPNSVEFDSGGFPVVPHREGHGQGLRSIAALAEKYHGLFQCSYDQGVFTLQVVLLDATPDLHRSSQVPAVCAGVFLGLFLINCMPLPLARAVESVPLLGQLVHVVDMRSYSLGWGDSGITVQEPELTGGNHAVEVIENLKEEFIRQMEENFIWHAAKKYQGYVAEDITYTTIREDETLFILRFEATLNAGGSADYSRYVTLDQKTGQVLKLADLFLPESNYIFPISREIKAQMAEQVNAGEGSYFLPGGIWPDEECFQSIQPDQNFYINENGQLVIVFAEYEVAPGSMGTPEFVIPTDVLDGLLSQSTFLN